MDSRSASSARRTVDGIVGRALDAGINFIDTADVYSEGLSEELTGQALRRLGVKRSDVVIATKVHGRMGQGPNDRGSSRGHIMDAVEASLERLGLDHIDLYQIHGLDSVTPIEETIRALDDLVRQGLLRYVGVSNWPAWQIMKGARHRRAHRLVAPRLASRPTTPSPAATSSARSRRCSWTRASA